MKRILLSGLTLLSLSALLFAVETTTWKHDDQAEFEKGTLDKLSLRSDGRLFLAPESRELLDSSLVALWALARDSKGNLYAGGGGPGSPSAKLFRIRPDGTSETVAEFEELEVQAVTVDAADRVYAATSPSGKVYRISPEGRPEIFYDPGAKYIWALAFNSKGDLFVATGDKGEIHRVSKDGSGSVFFQTEETHVRSLVIDSSDNLIVGTEPGGLVLRVTNAGAGFVLYQSPKREITTVAVAPDGHIYAAGFGTKKAARPLPSLIPISPVTTAQPRPVPAKPSSPPQPVLSPTTAATAPPIVMPRAKVTGGSELYCVAPDGYSRRVWHSRNEIIYAIAIDGEGHPVFGTGNSGKLYRLENRHLSTRLLKLSPSQIVSLCSGPDGRLYAATANVGKVYRIGPNIEKQGSYTSPALDADSFSYWGRIVWRGDTRGGKISLSARSGNLDRPRRNWSPWSEVALSGAGGRVVAPAARFLQYRVMLAAADSAQSPEVASIEVAYQNKNVAPVVRRIAATPPNYRFPPQVITITKTRSLTLPPLGGRKSTKPSKPLTTSRSQTMQYAKGSIGARWLAEDDNGDKLLYKLEIRGAGESEWKPLKDKLKKAHWSWDSTAFPDGEYRIRVTASDSPNNPPQYALSAQLEGEPFLIDNTPPRIVDLTASVTSSGLTATWKAVDARSRIQKAEYSLDGGEWTVVEPVSRLSDSPKLDYKLTLGTISRGEHTLAVRVTDLFDNQVVAKTIVK